MPPGQEWSKFAKQIQERYHGNSYHIGIISGNVKEVGGFFASCQLSVPQFSWPFRPRGTRDLPRIAQPRGLQELKKERPCFAASVINRAQKKLQIFDSLMDLVGLFVQRKQIESSPNDSRNRPLFLLS